MLVENLRELDEKILAIANDERHQEWTKILVDRGRRCLPVEGMSHRYFHGQKGVFAPLIEVLTIGATTEATYRRTVQWVSDFPFFAHGGPNVGPNEVGQERLGGRGIVRRLVEGHHPIQPARLRIKYPIGVGSFPWSPKALEA
jgi:hypothetical protein